MKKRKPSSAKRTVTQTPATTRKRKSRGRTQDRAAPAATASGLLVHPQINKRFPLQVPPDDDEDVFIPPGFQFELPIDPVQGPAPVVVLAPSTLPRDIEEALWQSFNTSPVLSPGFDERGVCKYGCDGCVSLKDPMLGMHAYSCPFWDSAEGIKLMLRFEKTDFPPFK